MALNEGENVWFTHPWALALEDPKHLEFVRTPSRVASDDGNGEVLREELV